MKSAIVLLLMMVVRSTEMFGQGSSHPLGTISSGGGRHVSGSTILLSTVGGIGSQTANSSDTSLSSGFLAAAMQYRRGITTSLIQPHADWNLVSVPLTLPGYATSALFPGALSTAFEYTQSYRGRDSLEIGKAYWMKFAGTETYEFAGSPVDAETIDVYANWNMIGALTNPIPFESITPVPPLEIRSSLYGFEGAYSTATSLAPGKGYWIKVSQAGKLVLQSGFSASPVAGSAKASRRVPGPFSESLQPALLTVRDAEGREGQLRVYSTDESVDLSLLELPPIPPAGIFDVRFASQRLVEVIGTSDSITSLPILLQDAKFPLRLLWEIPANAMSMTIETIREDRSRSRHAIEGDGTLTLSGEDVAGLTLVVNDGKDEIPLKFSLSQNFPNPFNPRTTFRFELPQNSVVTLRLYNTLGEEVSRILSQKNLEAGRHDIMFDAADLASGVYYYRLEAVGVTESFVDVKKMMVVK